jgi:hypothetical protein
MKIHFFKKLLFNLFCCYLPFASFAWGVEGHRIVGHIAESYLTENARKEIRKILGTESIAMASNWADFIKSDTSFNYISSWHYINLKGGLSSTELKAYLSQDTAVDVYTRINFLVKELKSKKLSKENKIFYLKLLIHFVGDIHQPLHAGRFEDLGGNKIKVNWFSDLKNLHQIWDDQLILFQQLSYTEYSTAINHTNPTQIKTWQQEPLSEWIIQSYQLSEKIYSDIKQPNQRLEYRYNFNYVSILNQQLLKGGVHLAGVLNDIFKG